MLTFEQLRKDTIKRWCVSPRDIERGLAATNLTTIQTSDKLLWEKFSLKIDKPYTKIILNLLIGGTLWVGNIQVEPKSAGKLVVSETTATIKTFVY